MMDIDWSRAPESANYYCKKMRAFTSDAAPCTECIPLPAKPAAPEWGGEGLPPAGCECEYRPDPTMRPSWWEPCIYLAHYDDEHFVIMRENSGVDRMSDSPPADVRFRPIRTQAERERDDLIKLIRRHPIFKFSVDRLADEIISAGWRKPEGK